VLRPIGGRIRPLGHRGMPLADLYEGPRRGDAVPIPHGRPLDERLRIHGARDLRHAKDIRADPGARERDPRLMLGSDRLGDNLDRRPQDLWIVPHGAPHTRLAPDIGRRDPRPPIPGLSNLPRGEGLQGVAHIDRRDSRDPLGGRPLQPRGLDPL
jgi:hypothetical protein